MEPSPPKLSYVTPPPPPVRRRPYRSLAVIVGVLTVLLVVVFRIAPGMDDPQYVFVRYTLRFLVLAWLASIGAIVWSLYDERRRARVWMNARVVRDDVQVGDNDRSR